MSLDFLPPQAYTKETLLKAYNWLQSQSDQVKELATTPDQLVSLYLKSSRLGHGQDSLQRYTATPVQNSQPQPRQEISRSTSPMASNLSSHVSESNGTVGNQQISANSSAQSNNQSGLISQALSQLTNQYSASTQPNSSFQNSADRPSVQSFKSELKNLAGLMGDLEKPQSAPTPKAYQSQAYQGPPSQQQEAPSTTYRAPAQTPASTQQVAPQAAATNAYVSSLSHSAQSSQSALNFDESTQIMIREVKNELNLSSDTEALRMLVKIGYQKVKSLYK